MRWSIKSWRDLSWTDALILGTSASTAAAALYLLFYDDEKELTPDYATMGGGGGNDKRETVTSRQTVIEVKIPKEAAGDVIGPQGIVIKQIQAETGARIHFKDESSTDTERVLMVRGNQESAQKAEMMIKQIVHDIPEKHTVDIFVPQRFLGRLIGKNGDNIRNLQRSSKAKVVIERTTDEKNPTAAKKVTISGSAEQIELARGLIEEQLEEDEAFRRKQQIAADARAKKSKKPVVKAEETRDVRCNKNIADAPCLDGSGDGWTSKTNGVVDATSTDSISSSLTTVSHCAETTISSSHSSTVELPKHGNYFEVFVSALDVEEANRIWIQLFSKVDELNTLNRKIANLYNGTEGHKYRLPGDVGDLVADDDGDKDGRLYAAKLTSLDDLKWFRAKLLKKLDNLFEVFYVDYGDVACVSRDEIRVLREDFTSDIPFQAVECLIAGIKAPLSDDYSNSTTVTPSLGDLSMSSSDGKKNGGTNDVSREDQVAEFISSVIDDVEATNRSETNRDNLTGVSDKNRTEQGGVWTEAALDYVDDVTKNAQWVCLYAKILGWVEEENGKRIPKLELVDTNGATDVDIATSIVKAGHAVWIDDNDTQQRV